MSNVIAKGISSKLSEAEKIQQQINLGLGNVIHTGNEQQVGVNQTWQDVTASRAYGIAYTNSTGKPIQIAISYKGLTGFNVYIDGIQIARTDIGTDDRGSKSFIIPNGSTYMITSSTTMLYWAELR